ncbi:MAG: response regulator, partial [Mesorhizobium sp.]|uniref:response regulator n=1 Tax=Mesorhizobium sp. TaxID=1871066 RepID=UPI001217C489
HNGNVWFEEVLPRGARFVVQLPAISGRAAAAGESPSRSSGLRHALIIDDEPDVAASLSDILELMGIKSRIVPAWASAAATLSGHMPPDIVFSDLRMPGTSGISIYRELLAEKPDLARRFVLVTGDLIGAKAEIEALPAPQRPQILEKPFSTLDVRGVLSAIAEQAALGS